MSMFAEIGRFGGAHWYEPPFIIDLMGHKKRGQFVMTTHCQQLLH